MLHQVAVAWSELCDLQCSPRPVCPCQPAIRCTIVYTRYASTKILHCSIAAPTALRASSTLVQLPDHSAQGLCGAHMQAVTADPTPAEAFGAPEEALHDHSSVVEDAVPDAVAPPGNDTYAEAVVEVLRPLCVKCRTNCMNEMAECLTATQNDVYCCTQCPRPSHTSLSDWWIVCALIIMHWSLPQPEPAEEAPEAPTADVAENGAVNGEGSRKKSRAKKRKGGGK